MTLEKPLDISRCLRVTQDSRIAIVGSGGKTSTLFRIGREISPPVILGATAHMAIEQCSLADNHVVITGPEDFDALIRGRCPEGVTLFTGPMGNNGRTIGLSQENSLQLKHLVDRWSVPLIIESDGARGLPLKAPGIHEPPIPEWVNHVVVVAGLSGIGKPLCDEFVFRSEEFEKLSGLRGNQPISWEALVKVLVHSQGGLKNIPSGAWKTVFFNQLDTLPDSYEVFINCAELNSAYQSVLFGNLQPTKLFRQGIHYRQEKVAGIILAAGASNRLGQPKQLLDWFGKPFVRIVAEKALEAGLDPVIVVVGAHAAQVTEAVHGLKVAVLENRNWETGQSSSIATGIRSVENSTGASIFLLSDQPQVNPSLINTLITPHRTESAVIIAPVVDGQRTNPVLFDKTCYKDLASLVGDTGGRELFRKFGFAPVNWDDPAMLMDVDTWEDYLGLVKLVQERDQK